MTTPWTGRATFLENVWKQLDKMPQYRNHMRNNIVDVLRGYPDYQILDCGCGTGLTYESLPPEYRHRYTGLDFTQDMVDYCREKHPGGKFIQADLLDHGSYTGADLMITQNVLQHILLWQEAMRGIYAKEPQVIIMCERTHSKPSMIFGYSPAVRWVFNVDDYRKAMEYYGRDKYTPVEILGHPRNTKNQPDMLTIYRTRRRT